MRALLLVLRSILAWLAKFFAGQVFVQFLSAFPAAYICGLAYDARVLAEMTFDSLPTLFWPILAVLVFLTSGYHGWVKAFREWRARKRRKLEEREKRKQALLRHTHWMIKHAINPNILESDTERGNPDRLFAIAQSTVLNFIPECREIDWQPETVPPTAIQTKEDLFEWDRYMDALRPISSDL